MRVLLLALAPIWTGSVAAVAPDAPVYVVARIGSDLTDDQLVGRKRAGLACLPAGTLRWKDVSTGSTMDQREVVQDELEDSGLAVTPLGETVSESRSQRRLRGTVTAIDFQLCAKHWGLGDKNAFNGTAQLEIQWRIEQRSGAAPLTHATNASRTVAAHEAMPASSIYRALLKQSARELAQWLETEPALNK